MKDKQIIDKEQDINIQNIKIYKSDMELLKNYIDTTQPLKTQKDPNKSLKDNNSFSILTVIDDVSPNVSEDYTDEVTGTIEEDETYASQLTEQSESANEQSYYEEEETIGKHF